MGKRENERGKEMELKERGKVSGEEENGERESIGRGKERRERQ
jgi:hypothetical protein